MEEKREECGDDAGEDEVEKGLGIDSDRTVIQDKDSNKTHIFNWVKDEKEPFLSGVFSMVDTMEIPEWKGTPGAGHTVEEFVLQGTCGEGGNGELGMDKHNDEME